MMKHLWKKLKKEENFKITFKYSLFIDPFYPNLDQNISIYLLM